jgi:hypothetical protein
MIADAVVGNAPSQPSTPALHQLDTRPLRLRCKMFDVQRFSTIHSVSMTIAVFCLGLCFVVHLEASEEETICGHGHAGTLQSVTDLSSTVEPSCRS